MLFTDFIEVSNRAESMEDLVSAFVSVISKMGYDSFCAYTLRGPKLEMTASPHYPAEFVKRYENEKWLDSDPLFKLFCRARSPFTWEQLNSLPLNKRQKEIMEARYEIGFKRGVGVPVLGVDPQTVGVSIESRLETPQSDSNALAWLYAASNQYQLRRMHILGRDKILDLPTVHLTPREKEMLEWAAHGKSNSIISEILGISEKTVEFYFKSIFNKLEVSSRTTAALKAVQMKLITI